MRDGDEDKEKLSGEGARKMLVGYEVCNRVDGECHTKMTLEQKPKEVKSCGSPEKKHSVWQETGSCLECLRNPRRATVVSRK